MSRNVITIAKWLPPEISNESTLFLECKHFKKQTNNLISNISSFLCNIQCKIKSKLFYNLIENELDLQLLEDFPLTLNAIGDNFGKLFHSLEMKQKSDLTQKKYTFWKNSLWRLKLQLCFYLQSILIETGYLFVYFGDHLLGNIIRLCKIFNHLLAMDQKYQIKVNVNVCSNTCPNLLFPMRKMSVTRILQILALNRAEICCHKLIDCLLDTYKYYENGDDDNESDNSSIEIYRALTKHMSLPVDEVKNKNEEFKNNFSPPDNECFHNMEKLLSYEEKNVEDLLQAVLKLAPQMLGTDGVKRSKTSGDSRISGKAKQKVLEYYEEVLWGEVANYLEHVVIWWAPSPLAIRAPHSSQHLREWIIQFIPAADLPQVILSALTSLADALGVHVTSTSWDRHFRLALVASDATTNLETGQLFCDTLQDLVNLCNLCESTPDWIIGAPLDELPLVEQIPILHRLDHSIHTTRLWALSETKKYAHNLNVDAFFKITCKDITNCLAALKELKLRDHGIEIQKGGLGVHVEVCTLMRAKLFSEVDVNSQKLKDAPSECLNNLASIYRIICLANLQMIFPPQSCWRELNIKPSSASTYVDTYLNETVYPVVCATQDPIINNMILKLICESWLDHIYTNKIKFSRFGAMQLLYDFAHVKVWLSNCKVVDDHLKQLMMNNEILRRCEGVGKLLLRNPGEHIKMTDKEELKKSNSPSNKKSDLMPPEMYVPNQEQWLALRAVKKKFMPLLCCDNVL